LKNPNNVLLCGFEAFDGEQLNPSWLVAERVAQENLAEKEGAFAVNAVQLPCEFDRSLIVLTEAIERHQPSLVLCLGQAGGRPDISVERIGINCMDAPIADNAGSQPIDSAVIEHAEAAFFSTLPIKAIVQSLRDEGIPASVSNSAGTYVCNQVLYGVLQYLARQDLSDVRAGFIHLPYLPEQALSHRGAASMSLDVMVKAIRLGLRVAIDTQKDIRLEAGQSH